MPALTPAQIASQRLHPQRLGEQFLYIFIPRVELAARVNGNIGRVQDIVFHNVTQGAFTNVFRGMTLLVGTTAGGREKGFVRMRAAAADGLLHASEHEIDLEDGDYLTVLDEYRLWHVDPFIHTDGEIYKDWNGVAPGGEIDFPAGWEDIYQPVPVMGPHSIEFIDPSTGLASHGWDWSESWPINPLAGAGLTYAAVFEDGTPPTSFAETGTVTWGTAGHRWAHLAVQDTRGIVSYTSRRLYVTLDRDNLPSNCYVDFQPSPRMGSVDGGGFNMTFTVQVDAPESAFPDHALVIWFFDGGTQEDIGGNWPHRSHIKFIGYICKASTHKEPETGHVTFEATTIQGVMRALPMFPNFYEDVDAGDCDIWTEAVSLTVQRAAYLHMRWQSSLLEMADVLFVPDADTPIGEHEFPEGFLYDQLNALVNRDYLYRIGCDPLSTIYFNKDPQFLTAQPDTIMDIQAQDWREELDFPEPLELRTAYVIASGNAYAAGVLTPRFSEAPGPVPLQLGRRDKSLARLICTTQDALNVVSGLALAAANDNFPDIPIKLDGQYYVGHLFPMELVGLDIQGVLLPRGTKRGMNLSADLFVPRRSNLQVVYDSDGALSNALVDINVEKLTTGEGVDGQTLTYPASTGDFTVPGPDEGPDGGDWEPPAPVDPGGVPADGNLLYFIDYVSGRLYRTRNARHSDPTAVVYEDLGVVGANPMYIALDPWDPTNAAMVQCYHDIYRTDDLDVATPTWTNKLNIAVPSYIWHIAASICQEGLWMATGFFNNVGAGTWFPRGWSTTTGGNAWTPFWVTPGVEGRWIKCEMSAHDATKAWVMVFNSAGGLCKAGASVNINGVAPTFAYTTMWSGASDPPMCNPYHRYKDNPTDQVALWCGEQSNAPVSARTKFCAADVASCTEATLGGGTPYDPRWAGGYTWGTNKYWVLVDYNKFFISDDGINWTLQHTFAGTTRFISGWPYDGERFYATQDGAVAPILISDDRGLNWQAQTGSGATGWAAVGPGATADIYCCVPVWLE